MRLYGLYTGPVSAEVVLPVGTSVALPVDLIEADLTGSGDALIPMATTFSNTCHEPVNNTNNQQRVDVNSRLFVHPSARALGPRGPAGRADKRTESR